MCYATVWTSPLLLSSMFTVYRRSVSTYSFLISLPMRFGWRDVFPSACATVEWPLQAASRAFQWQKAVLATPCCSWITCTPHRWSCVATGPKQLWSTGSGHGAAGFQSHGDWKPFGSSLKWWFGRNCWGVRKHPSHKYFQQLLMIRSIQRCVQELIQTRIDSHSRMKRLQQAVWTKIPWFEIHVVVQYALEACALSKTTPTNELGWDFGTALCQYYSLAEAIFWK